MRMMINETMVERRLRLSKYGIDILLLKYQLAQSRAVEAKPSVVYATFPKRTAPQVRDAFVAAGYEASVHRFNGPRAEVVLYVK